MMFLARVQLLTFVALGILTNEVAADSARLFNPDNNHYYQLFNQGLSWKEARDACVEKDGYLATVTSQIENDWVFENLVSGVGRAWLGGTDEALEGSWQWVTGEPWVYTNWNAGEPNNLGNEDFLWMYGTDDWAGNWNDIYNNYSVNYYLCEWDHAVQISLLRATPQVGSAPMVVEFHVHARSPNLLTRYIWDLNGDGNDDEVTTTPTLTHTYTENGTFHARVTVEDSAGGRVARSKKIQLESGVELLGTVERYLYDTASRQVELTLKIANTGDKDAGAFLVVLTGRLSADRKVVRVDGLSAGESTMLYETFNFSHSLYGEKFKIYIDRTELVPELDDSNNDLLYLLGPLESE